jgi:hypothetical protein
VSADLVTKIELGLEELAAVREQLSPLIAKPPGYEPRPDLRSFLVDSTSVLSEFQ